MDRHKMHRGKGWKEGRKGRRTVTGLAWPTLTTIRVQAIIGIIAILIIATVAIWERRNFG